MKIHKFYISLILLTQVCACKKDFLDVPDKRVLLRQAYVKDLTTTSHFLNGTYTELSSKFFEAMAVCYGELIADNIKPVSDAGFLIPHYSWNQQEDDTRNLQIDFSGNNVNGLWTAGYKIARECSFVIEASDQYRLENPALADDLKGQAYAIRALVLHQLVNVYAQPFGYTTGGSHIGIPYVKSSLYTEKVSRQSVSEVYQNLIDDLKHGIMLMPEKPLNVKDVNRFEVMNKDAATAILARVYLYKGDYENAKQLSIDIAGKYPLMSGSDYPAKLFTNADRESMLRLTPADGIANYTTYFTGTYFRSFKQFLATRDIWNLLKLSATDSRQAWVTATKLSDNTIDSTITKFPRSVTGKISEADADYYHAIIRSSEMTLTAAESFYMLGDQTNAKNYLDKVRLRADPSAGITNVSGSALLEMIQIERNKELCFEGMRMFDLLRWKKGVHRTNPLNIGITDLPYPSQKAIAPIPLLDVQLSGFIQNEGY